MPDRAEHENGAGGHRVLIVDDHALLSTTLVIALQTRGIAARRSEVGTEEIRLVIAGSAPGVALVDVDLGTDPDGRALSGVDLVPVLVGAGWRVVMLTGGAGEPELAAAVVAGATGWLHKMMPFEDLLDAVLAVVAGDQVLSENERLRLTRLHYAQHAHQQARRAGFDRLTAREREVLRGLVAGKRAAAIAEESVVSLATVRAQIRSILAKLEVTSQLEAVALVREIEGL
jgi:DNA-binding NarL/FixJ family response regulator